jgi:uncharacterized protein (TIGR02646 family)
MIRITRANPAPLVLTSQKVKDAAKLIAEIAVVRKPLSKEFKSHWGDAEVRDALWRMQNHKCCYCERKRERNRESDVEHFRPKAEVTDAAPTHKGYWWLAYHWENLFFSCRYCNQEHKLNYFPVRDEAKRALSEINSLTEEDAFLINPTEKDPEEHIGFDWYKIPSNAQTGTQTVAFARGRTIYGTKTIEIVGLNECDLPNERGDLVIELEGLAALMVAAKFGVYETVERMAQRIKEATSSKLPFTAFRRDFFQKQNLGEYVSTD